jgi:hypothetical protein
MCIYNKQESPKVIMDKLWEYISASHTNPSAPPIPITDDHIQMLSKIFHFISNKQIVYTSETCERSKRWHGAHAKPRRSNNHVMFRKPHLFVFSHGLKIGSYEMMYIESLDAEPSPLETCTKRVDATDDSDYFYEHLCHEFDECDHKSGCDICLHERQGLDYHYWLSMAKKIGTYTPDKRMRQDAQERCIYDHFIQQLRELGILDSLQYTIEKMCTTMSLERDDADVDRPGTICHYYAYIRPESEYRSKLRELLSKGIEPTHK